MLLAEVSADEWVRVLTTFGSLVLIPLAGLYFKYRLDTIATKQKEIADATGAVPNRPTLVDKLDIVVKEQVATKQAIEKQTEKTVIRDEILRDVQTKVNGPHEASLKKIWELLEEKVAASRKSEDQANADTAHKAYLDSKIILERKS